MIFNVMIKDYFFIVFVKMFLRDERNHDAMMTTIEEIVRDVSGVKLCEEMTRAGSDEDSVIVLSDDEYEHEEETRMSAVSMPQLRVLESCWREWPFPSQDMVSSHKILYSDWSIFSILYSDWSLFQILCSDWSTFLILYSNWFG